MTDQLREYTIELPHTNGLVAKIEVRRGGQNGANVDDLVWARGRLCLPIDPKTSQIPDAIQFGTRVRILGTPLGEHWGSQYEGMRAASEIYDAKTWREAMDGVEELVRGELQKLLDALEVRHQALVDAEKDPEF